MNNNSDITFSNLSLSVVIPVRDEAESILGLFEECKSMCEERFAEYEIIIVNDGSIDRTGSVCRTFHPLKYVEFDSPYGQTAALDCGFKLSSCDYVAAIDGDGQNNPSDIPIMLKYLVDNNLDVVCGWRKNRQDNVFRRLLMKMAYVCRQVFLRDGIHDSGCTLKVFRKGALEGLDLVGGQHRFIPAIMRGKGSKVGEIVVSHRPRKRGRSKYNSLSRVFQGLRDLFAIRRGSSKRTPITYAIKEIIDY
ncbi:MAG: glycosyltransferase [Bacteroidales bacterium]|nr:glycosyltransferase [Bacteroidales bacterium]